MDASSMLDCSICYALLIDPVVVSKCSQGETGGDKPAFACVHRVEGFAG